MTHTFYSYDPMAKASKNVDLPPVIWIFQRLRRHREWSSQEKSYDAMVYVTNAHPTRIKNAGEVL